MKLGEEEFGQNLWDIKLKAKLSEMCEYPQTKKSKSAGLCIEVKSCENCRFLPVIYKNCLFVKKGYFSFRLIYFTRIVIQVLRT